MTKIAAQITGKVKATINGEEMEFFLTVERDGAVNLMSKEEGQHGSKYEVAVEPNGMLDVVRNGNLSLNESKLHLHTEGYSRLKLDTPNGVAEFWLEKYKEGFILRSALKGEPYSDRTEAGCGDINDTEGELWTLANGNIGRRRFSK